MYGLQPVNGNHMMMLSNSFILFFFHFNAWNKQDLTSDELYSVMAILRIQHHHHLVHIYEKKHWERKKDGKKPKIQ